MDVINISLGFRNLPVDDKKNLEKVFQKVQSEGIVVFAATSNEGSHEDVAWPASDRRYAIGVHSCIDSGTKPSDDSAPPSRDGENFMVVGENILTQRLTTKGGGFTVVTGSSFATPVASAIGVLLIQYVSQRMCKGHRADAQGRVSLDSLKSNAGMAKMFRQISCKHGDYYSVNSRLLWHDLVSEPDWRKARDHAMDHAWKVIEQALK